jgi:hypothetical protein
MAEEWSTVVQPDSATLREIEVVSEALECSGRPGAEAQAVGVGFLAVSEPNDDAPDPRWRLARQSAEERSD